MKAIDVTKLVEGLLVVIFLALAVGHYNDLRSFAIREASASLKGWPTRTFFPSTYRKVFGAHPQKRSSLEGGDVSKNDTSFKSTRNQ